MRFRQFVLGGAIAVAAISPAVHAATVPTVPVVFSDNFDSNPLKTDLAPAGWTLNGEGTVDLIGQSNVAGSAVGLPDPLPGNGVYVDLVGAKGINSYLISPTFSLNVGVEYAATFKLAGNQSLTAGTESVEVSFGDTSFTYSIPYDEGFTLHTLKFTPTSQADYSISFKTVTQRSPTGGLVISGSPNIGGDPTPPNPGALLDALVITAVPEPASYALLLAGLVGLHVVARRRIQP